MTKRKPTQTAAPDQAPTVDIFFPLYARDWITGGATFPMTNRERGAFLQLLAWAWIQDPAASLPDDDRQLAKFADETAAGWAEVREVLLAQFPLELEGAPADGRRRNPKQWRVYLESVEHRAGAIARAQKAAAARWGHRDEADGSAEEVSEDSSSNASSNADAPQADPKPAKPLTLSALLKPYPALAAWAKTPDEGKARTELLKRAAAVVRDYHGAEAVSGFLALVQGALEGLDQEVRTAAEVQTALADWCDTARQRGYTKNSLRNFLTGVRPPKGSASANGNGAGKAIALDTAKAGAILAALKAAKTGQVIPRKAVEAYGTHVVTAYLAVGGSERVLAQEPKYWGALVSDFAKAIAAAEAGTIQAPVEKAPPALQAPSQAPEPGTMTPEGRAAGWDAMKAALGVKRPQEPAA